MRMSDWSSDVCFSDLVDVPERAEPLTYFHELDDLLYSVTSQTFIGELYAMAGLENIADAADVDGQSGGYPHLSAEYVSDADPDLILLADAECCGEPEETVAARPGFATRSAGADGTSVQRAKDNASRRSEAGSGGEGGGRTSETRG